MEVVVNDLLFLGQLQIFADIPDLEHRMKDGLYLTSDEVQSIADLCGVSLARLRQLNEPKVTPARFVQAFAQKHSVGNTVKHRRITNIARFLDMIATVGEALISDIAVRRDRAAPRKEMLDDLLVRRPSFRRSRVRGVVDHQELARVPWNAARHILSPQTWRRRRLLIKAKAAKPPSISGKPAGSGTDATEFGTSSTPMVQV